MKQAKNTEKTNAKTKKNSIPAVEKAANAGAFEDSWEGRNWSKPKLEEARLGIPISMELLGNPDNEFPIMADSMEYGRQFQVDDGKVYTVRLGIKSDSEGIGAIPKNSAATIFIPTVPARETQITATFAFPEMFPVIFADAVRLYSETEFSLEYVYGSAQLECNSIFDTKALPLNDTALEQVGDDIVIGHTNLNNLLPAHCTYNYDFISVQVKVVSGAGS
jgi:hypothetical protein